MMLQSMATRLPSGNSNQRQQTSAFSLTSTLKMDGGIEGSVGGGATTTRVRPRALSVGCEGEGEAMTSFKMQRRFRGAKHAIAAAKSQGSEAASRPQRNQYTF